MAAVRETREETGIALDPQALRHAVSVHQRNPGGHARIGFAFEPGTWSGEPANTEPHKHSELVWADSALPPDTVVAAGQGVVDGQAALLDFRPGPTGRSIPTRCRRSPAAAALCSGSVITWCQAQARSWSATACPPQKARTRPRPAMTSIRVPRCRASAHDVR